MLADALEAVIGAVYLDAGFDKANQLVRRLFKDVEVNPQMKAIGKDPKTELQEWLQGRKMSLPLYRVVGTTGAAHMQTFEVECQITQLGRTERGSGNSRRAGEQAAATAMLRFLKTQTS
jgi:ribonuclease-3